MTPAKTKAKATSADRVQRPRWRTWLVRSLAVVVVLLALARITLGMWLPGLIQGLADDQGWRCGYERLDLSLSTLEVGLSHLQLDPAEGEGPSLHLEFVHADVSVWNLLFGEIVVPRVEVDGLDVTLVRNADGEIVMPSLASAAGASGPSGAGPDGQADAEEPAQPDSDAGVDDEPASLLSPVRVDALRVQNVQVNWRDETVDPPLVTRLDLDLRVSDLGSPDRPARIAMTAAASGLVDRVHFEVTGSSTVADAQAALTLRLGGLDLGPCAELLAPFGLSQVAGPLHCDLVGEVSLSNDPTRPALQLSLNDLSLGNGGERDVSLSQLSVLIPAWGDDLTVEDVTVEGLSAGALREQDGAMLFAGLRLVPTAGRPADQSVSEPSEPGGGGLSLGRLHLLNHSVAWRDESVLPAADVTLVLEEMTVADLATGTALVEPARLDARLSAPGIFESLTLGGSVQPMRSGGRVRLDMALAGLAPDALQGYLDAAGVQHHMVDGRLDMTVKGAWRHELDGSLHGDGGLTTLTFGAAGEELSLGSVSVEGLVAAADGQAIHIETIAFKGLEGKLAWDEAGLLHLPGLAIGAPVQGPTDEAPVAASETAGTTTGTGSGPASGSSPATALTLGSLTLDARRLVLAPAHRPPLAFSALGVSLDDLRMAEGSPTVQHYDLRLALPGVVRDFHVDGAVSEEGEALVVDMELLAVGLDATVAAALMDEAGPQPSLKDGELSLSLRAQVLDGPNGLAAGLSLDDLSLSDGGRRLLGLKQLSVDEVLLGDGDVSVGDVIVDSPFVYVSRDALGGLHLPGLFLKAAELGEESTAGSPEVDPVVKEAPVVVASAATAQNTGGDETLDESGSSDPQIRLAHLALLGGKVQFDDGAAADLLSSDLLFALDVAGLELGDDPQPTELSLTVSVPGSLERLVLAGQVVAATRRPRADLTLRGRGMTLASVASYLAPVARPALADGRLNLRLQAGVTAHELGGQGLSLALSEFAFRDGAEGAPLVGFDELSFSADRIDGPARVFEIDQLRWVGLRGAASRDEMGALHALGLVLPPVVPEPGAAPGLMAEGAAEDAVAEEAAAEEAAADEEAATDDVAVEDVAVAEPSGADESGEPEAVAMVSSPESEDEPVQDLAAIAAASAVRALPTWLTVKSFVVGVDRFDWVDAGKDPLAVQDVTLRNVGPIVLEDDTTSSPFEVQLVGSVSPVLDEFGMTATLDPFAIEPEAKIDVFFSGLDGPALGRLAPELIDGDGLADGRFTAHLDAAWLGRRRGPLDFGVANGIPLEFSLSDVAFRDGVDGDVLLGLSELRAEIDEALGLSGNMRLRSLEVIKPVARIVRNDRGMQVGHLLFLNPAEPEGEPLDDVPAGDGLAASDNVDSDDDAPEEVDSAEDLAAAAAPVSEPVGEILAEPGPEIAVKSLLMSGLDVEFRDLTTDPPLVLPLTGLDVDVRDFTTRAFTEPLPLSAVLFLRGGIPDAELVPGRESRPIFDEISVDGRWTLFPQLTGKTQVQLNALELVSFRGPAAASNVVIDDGVLDAKIEIEFEDDGDLATESRFLFGDLDIDEPADGPISRFLKLPSALGSILFVLRDEDGVIDIPLNVDVAADGLSVGEVSQVAVTTLGVLIGSAVAAAPFRVVGGVTDGVGSLLGFEGEEVDPGEPVEVRFNAGELWLSPAEEERLVTMAAGFAEDPGLVVTLRHEMGLGDQSVMGERANPPLDWMAEMAGRLRVQKALLAEERSLVAERLGAELTSGLALSAAASTRELNDLDERMGLAEQGLDEMLEMLRPGNERLAGRRTRKMSLSMAALRLDRVAAALRRELRPTEYGRVRVLTPRWDSETEREHAVIVMTPALRKGE